LPWHHEEITAEQARDLRALAGAIIPPSRDYGVPGADDELIFNDILRSLERDHDDIRRALAHLAALAGGAFADLGPERRTEGGRHLSRNWRRAACGIGPRGIAFATIATTG